MLSYFSNVIWFNHGKPWDFFRFSSTVDNVYFCNTLIFACPKFKEAIHIVFLWAFKSDVEFLYTYSKIISKLIEKSQGRILRSP